MTASFIVCLCLVLQWTRGVVQCQLHALQDSKQKSSHSDKFEKESPGISALVAAQQLLELSMGKGAGRIKTIRPKQEVRLNGMVRPLPQSFNKEGLHLVPMNGDSGTVERDSDGGGCKGDSGDISEGGDDRVSEDGSVGSEGDGVSKVSSGEGGGVSEACVSTLSLPYSTKEKTWGSMASKHCEEVPPDPPDKNGSSSSNHMDHRTEMEEEEEEVERRRGEDELMKVEGRQEEIEEEPMDVQTEPEPHPWENLFGMLL